MAKAKLTKAFVETVEAPKSGTVVYFDTELPGFGLRVTKNGVKSFILKYTLRTRDHNNIPRTLQRRQVIGRAAEMPVGKARLTAKNWRASVQLGGDPAGEIQERKRAAADRALGLEAPTGVPTITLSEAWAVYENELVNVRRRSPKTVDAYSKNINNHLQKYLDKPMATLGANAAWRRDLRDSLGSQTGEHTANSVLRTFSAIYNHTRREHTSLPELPRVEPIKTDKLPPVALKPEELPSWFAQLSRIDDEVLRDALLFGLLTGMRGGDGGHMAGVGVGVVSLRWEHINFEDKTLTIEPKTKDELVLPISTAMETILLRRRAATNGPWVFPNPRAKSGHLPTMRKPKLIFRSGHNLRHSFEALAKHAGAYQEQIDALTGHAGQGTDAKFYPRGENADIVNVLRPTQEKISSFIMGHQQHSGEVSSAFKEGTEAQ